MVLCDLWAHSVACPRVSRQRWQTRQISGTIHLSSALIVATKCSAMAVPLEQFIQRLQDSGIIDGSVLADFVPPKGAPRDSEELARELVRQKKLTAYQAQTIYQGQGKSLLLGNYVILDKLGQGGMG